MVTFPAGITCNWDVKVKINKRFTLPGKRLVFPLHFDFALIARETVAHKHGSQFSISMRSPFSKGDDER